MPTLPSLWSIKLHLFGGLFDGVFSAWAKEWSKEHGIKMDFVQPDTANTNLLAFEIRGLRLSIEGNEWANIMHVVLLDIFGLGVQETRCTENIHLHPNVYGLSEYQTVLGSAGDIASKELANPAATFRAVTLVLEHLAGCKGIEVAMEPALLTLRRCNTVTPDEEGNKVTTEVVDSIPDTVTTASQPPSKMVLSKPLSAAMASAEERIFLGKKISKIVMNFHNDFVVSGRY